MDSESPAETLRIVILGKTGNGKSSLGNALLGIKTPKEGSATEGFAVGRGMNSETRDCKWTRTIRFGANVEVTDTPGLSDTHLPEEVIYRELAKSVACAVPGPNIIIIALRCDHRFTTEEYMAYTKVKQLFSDDIDKVLIIVFNGIDQLTADSESDEDEKKTKEERQAEEQRRTEQQRGELAKEVKKCGSPLDSVIQAADGRYFGINNKASPAERDRQVRQLFTMMHDVMRKNRGVFYRTEMIDEINRRVEKMARQQAADSRQSQNDAMVSLKRDIVDNKVKPCFLDSLKEVVSIAASKVKDGVKKMCSVM
ncbi:hypothetical protein ACOMHN_013339 [Nucella lapillus]